MIVRPLSTVDNTRDYARVSHTVDGGLTITYHKYFMTCRNKQYARMNGSLHCNFMIRNVLLLLGYVMLFKKSQGSILVGSLDEI